MLPTVKTKTVNVEAIGAVEFQPMTARCYMDMLDAREEGKAELAVAALICQRCVPDWAEHTEDEILDSLPASSLIEVMIAIIEDAGVDDKKKPSENDPDDN